MTKEQFIAQEVEANPKFIKWAKEPTVALDARGNPETYGTVEKWHGLAYISTLDGTNTYNIFFMVDTVTGETTWQEFNTLAPETSTYNKRALAIRKYLTDNFEAHFILREDIVNDWMEADVFVTEATNLKKSTVLVYKPQGAPITHKLIV